MGEAKVADLSAELQECAAAHRRGANLARAIQERIKVAAEQAEAEQAKPASPSQPGAGPMDTGEPQLVGVKRPLVLSAEERSSLTSKVIQETSDDIEADVGAVVGLFADQGSAGSEAVKAKVRKLLETATGRAVQAAVPPPTEAPDDHVGGAR